jgi:hypothetical protein
LFYYVIATSIIEFIFFSLSEQMMQKINQAIQENAIKKSIPTELFMTNVASPTLARLIEEVKNDNQSTLHAYDRVHNRHNR